MARIRTIKPQFFTSEDVTALTPLARLLFVGLFTECDRDGRVEDRPRTLKMRLLPEDECDLDALLWSLVDGGLIRRYEADGVNIIQVSGFSKHQKPHPKEAASILAADGRTRQKTDLNTASRERVSDLPVENPSSPQCSLREGKEFQEGKGREGAAEQRPAAAPLVMSPLVYERRKQQCTFVGSRLEVPIGLHADLRKNLGGADPDAVLQAWYLALNDEIEQSGESIAPDVFKWLKARFATWVQSKLRADKGSELRERLEAIERGERKR